MIIFKDMATEGISIAPLRRHFGQIGCLASHWNLVVNTGQRGDVESEIRDLLAQTKAMLGPLDQSAASIGLCLDDVNVREAAKKLASNVRHVITLRTPCTASTDHTRMGCVYKLLNAEQPAFDIQLFANNHTAPHCFSPRLISAALTLLWLGKPVGTSRPICDAASLTTLKC